MILRAISVITCVAAMTSVPASADVTGRLVYTDRTFTFEGGFTGEEPEVGAPKSAVRVLDADTSVVLGAGFTDGDGNFSVPITASGPRDVIVRAFAVSEAYGTERIFVQDPSGVVYSTSSAVIAVDDLALDVDVGTVVAPILSADGGILGGSGLGGPFNLLHRAVQAIDYVTAQGAGPLPQEVVVTWPNLGGSFAQGSTANISLDDGFDDTVVLHELGHVLHFLYSESDNPGLGHGLGQSDQDPRLSLGEGWASFFAGAVRQWAGDPNPGFYMDCFGDGSTGQASSQLRMRFEDGFPYAAITEGEADEGAVFCALWDLIDRTDTDDGFPGDDDLVDGSFELVPGLSLDRVHWSVFTGPNVVSAPALHVVDVWDGYFVDAGVVATAELRDAFVGWSIHVVPDALEPNDDAGSATPIQVSPVWSPMRTLYADTSPIGAPGNGDVDAYAVVLQAGLSYEFETRYPNDNLDAGTYVDPALRLFDPSGSLVASADSGGDERNAKISDFTPALDGVHRVEVYAADPARPTGSYDLRVQPAAEPKPPLIQSLFPSANDSVFPTSQTALSVKGSELQGATSVTLDGVPTDFTVFDSTLIFVNVPLISSLGPVDLVVTTPSGSATATYTVTEPPLPVLNLANGIENWFAGSTETLQIGAGAGDLAFLLLSLTPGPTSVPGIAELGIGGDNLAALLLLDTFVLDGGGSLEFDIDVDLLPTGVDIHLQAALLDAVGLSLPLTPTNWAEARKVN